MKCKKINVLPWLHQMAVLEIQANGDAVVSKEAISSAGTSLEDPLMKVGTPTPDHPAVDCGETRWSGPSVLDVLLALFNISCTA